MQKIHSKLDRLDQRALLAVQAWRSRALTRVFVILTRSGTGRTWGISAAVLAAMNLTGLFLLPDQPRFLRAMAAAGLAWILSTILKRVVGRARPGKSIAGHEALVSIPLCGSFPSGHAASACAFALTLLAISHPLAALVSAWALLVTFSRLYVGVHYPTDLLAGLVVGMVSSTLVVALLF
jgi:undecaprenyl-diphosphatase